MIKKLVFASAAFLAASTAGAQADLLDTIKETLDCKIGGDTEDGLFHLMEVECLGACANAPMMQISHGGGDEYFVRSPPPSPALRRAPSHPRGACACRRT